MKRHVTGRGGIALLTSFLLSGCAISPIPLTSDEITAGTQDKLARVTQEQEPVTKSISLYEAMARALSHVLLSESSRALVASVAERRFGGGQLHGQADR